MDTKNIIRYCSEKFKNFVQKKEAMLIFRDKLPTSNRQQVIDKINEVCADLGIEPNWLMAVINFETAGTFSTSIQNPFSNATGLIQFMPSTAIGIGTTVTQLKQMSFIEQLDYVKKYYMPYRSKIKGFVDLYLATFFPVALGKPNEFVLETKTISASLIAKQNPVFDKYPKDGKVTVGEIKKVILTKVPAEYIKYLVTQPKNIIIGVLLTVAVIVILINSAN